MVKFGGLYLFSVLIFFLFVCLGTSKAERSFAINYNENSFYMDGKPFRYISGSAHYFRVPHQYWRDRLRKMKAAGLNAVSTYVEWSQHEPVPGVFEFSGDLDLIKFIQIAQQEDLYVILRPGPYICAERDFGGLPYWLIRKNPEIKLRSSDDLYQSYVEIWMDVLFSRLSDLWYGKGGPIIMVQVENEYGSYKACDSNHTLWLRDLFLRHVKNNAVLFTTDGGLDSLLTCGRIPGVYSTIDFGPFEDVDKIFKVWRKYEPTGPLVNSEFYLGWLTHWGENMASINTTKIITSLKQQLDLGTNVNFYMFFGGTNFGFSAGANVIETYLSIITSYDYDAAISEAGDLTEKYYAIQKVVHEYLPPAKYINVSSSEKGNYGTVVMRRSATLFSDMIREKMGREHKSENPKSFESLNQNSGYVLYETTIPPEFDQRNISLEIKQIKDLGNVYLNGKLVGIFSRERLRTKIFLPGPVGGKTLSIVVENLGRVNFGSSLLDRKGILTDVVLGNTVLKNWKMTGFELKDVRPVEYCRENTPLNLCDNSQGFVFYVGRFRIPKQDNPSEFPLDSYLEISELIKGVAFINGYNLGRYWTVRGPQFTLYVPGVYLKPFPHFNSIVILDENTKTSTVDVKFRTTPMFNY